MDQKHFKLSTSDLKKKKINQKIFQVAQLQQVSANFRRILNILKKTDGK